MSKTLISIGSLPVIRVLRPLYRNLLRALKRMSGLRSLRKLERRWRSREFRPESSLRVVSLSEVPIVVINLPDRQDRLAGFKGEMRRLNVGHFRVVAGVAGKELFPNLPGDYSGAIGCNLAHSNAIEANDWETETLLMVCEDDIEFLVDSNTLEALISEFESNPYLDVLCLAGRVRGPRIPISENLSVVTGVVGQACYVVKPQVVKPLANLWRSGVDDLANLKLRGKNDIIWNTLQREEAFFAFPRGRVARQRASYSDIQGRQMPAQESN